MKEFRFFEKYFNTDTIDDPKTKIIVRVDEKPSFDITEEDYSLSIETIHEVEKTIHRRCAIEHHRKQEKHDCPHLQFKLHDEKIGVFWINLNIKDEEEYEQAILGFIYRIKNILNKLEEHKPGITEEMLILEAVDKLEKENEFLNNKILESIFNGGLEFDKNAPKDKIQELGKNPLLISFLWEDNIEIIKSFHQE